MDTPQLRKSKLYGVGFAEEERFTKERANVHVLWFMNKHTEFQDGDLWEAYRIELEGWTIDGRHQASSYRRLRLRQFLRSRGVNVPNKNVGSLEEALYHTLVEEERAGWTAEDVRQQINHNGSATFKSRLNRDTNPDWSADLLIPAKTPAPEPPKRSRNGDRLPFESYSSGISPEEQSRRVTNI